MDIEKLIEQLRWWADHCDRTNYGCHTRAFLLDAATALSALQIENQALRNAASGFKAENEKLREMYQKEKAVCHAVQAELEQVKRERGAAIEAANGLDKMIGRAWGED